MLGPAAAAAAAAALPASGLLHGTPPLPQRGISLTLPAPQLGPATAAPGSCGSFASSSSAAAQAPGTITPQGHDEGGTAVGSCPVGQQPAYSAPSAAGRDLVPPALAGSRPSVQVGNLSSKSIDSFCGSKGVVMATEAWPNPQKAGRFPPVPTFINERRLLGGDGSEGPSESSTCRSGANNFDDKDTEEDDDFQATIPHLERFYEQLAAKARLPERNGASQNWVLSLARSYRRLSKEKRRRGGLRALLQPVGRPLGSLSGTASAGSGSGPMETQHGFSTDDSGYEAGYETDADESELSEWESGSASQRQQRHKRKLDALVHLTMKLSVGAELNAGSGALRGVEDEDAMVEGVHPPPYKAHKAFGTQPVGMRLALGSPGPLTVLETATENASVSSHPGSPSCGAGGGIASLAAASADDMKTDAGTAGSISIDMGTAGSQGIMTSCSASGAIVTSVPEMSEDAGVVSEQGLGGGLAAAVSCSPAIWQRSGAMDLG